MPERRLDRIAEKTAGSILRGSPDLVFRGFTIDSRKVRPGDLFFAVRGERDGHDFAADAVRQGASGVVVEHDIPLPGSAAVLMVDDSLAALQRLARRVLEDSGTRIIGITGSTGKTTTKEFTHTLVSEDRAVHKSEGNFNNHLGLPLSLLEMGEGPEWAVLEYGMNHPGEIRALTRIAAPDVAVVTNVHPVHMEFFRDQEHIAEAKRELLEGMKPGGTAVLNHDDPRVRDMISSSRGRTILFGVEPGAEISISGLERKGWEGLSFILEYGRDRIPVHLPFVNQGFITDFLAAAGAALALDLPPESVAEGARRLEIFADRGGVFRMNNGIRVMNDSYNSNPVALELALQTLTQLPGGRRIAVLGDMLELGRRGEEYHRTAGRRAAELGVDLLFTVGPLAAGIAEGALAGGMNPDRILSFEDSEQAAEALPPRLKTNDVILVKGSRGIHTEIVVEKLKGKG